MSIPFISSVLSRRSSSKIGVGRAKVVARRSSAACDFIGSLQPDTTVEMRARWLQPRWNDRRCRFYGSKTRISLDDAALNAIGEPLRPYIRTCLRETILECKEMDFAIAFLGTGGGSPSQHRNASCTALRLGGQTFLFDACEGTQRQLTFTTLLPAHVNKIFITHLHGDHLYGLPSQLLDMQIAAKMAMQAASKRRGGPGEPPTVEVYGPPGLYNYITITLALSCAKLNYLNVIVYELVGGSNERGPSATKRPGRRNIFLSKYPEFDDLHIHHRYIEKGEDNTWTIDEPEEITREDIQNMNERVPSKGSNNKVRSFSRLSNECNSGKFRRFYIKAAEIGNLRGVQTFGFTVEEQKLPINIDPEKARALGVKPGQKYNFLKSGFSVLTDDGSGEVHADQVMAGKVFRPRKFAILGKHCRIPTEMAQLCKNADLLVHEATMTDADGHEKAIMRGHTTASRAGSFGREMGCHVVALNHFGGTAHLQDHADLHLAEARESNGDASQIVASYDFMEVYIPRGGFSSRKEND